jgi:hypothetical protein
MLNMVSLNIFSYNQIWKNVLKEPLMINHNNSYSHLMIQLFKTLNIYQLIVKLIIKQFNTNRIMVWAKWHSKLMILKLLNQPRIKFVSHQIKHSVLCLFNLLISWWYLLTLQFFSLILPILHLVQKVQLF